MSLPRAWRRLDAGFFDRATPELARRLLGTVLVHRSEQGVCAGRIVETEAYLSSGDPASHSHRGPSRRNASMFAPAGTAYVYFVYGMHCCFNVSSAREGCGEAVLVRALEPLLGMELMRSRRGAVDERDLCRGPANLVCALGIRLEQDGASLLRGPLGLWSLDTRALEAPSIVAGPRIGIRHARELPLRFHVRDSRHVSKFSAPKPATCDSRATGRVAPRAGGAQR